MRRTALFLVLLVAFLPAALVRPSGAHTSEEYFIELDDNPEFKEAVVRLAKEYWFKVSGGRLEPAHFDSIRGKIAVNFDEAREKRVFISHYHGLEVYGFFFGDRWTKAEAQRQAITEEEARKRAEEVLKEEVPRRVQGELFFAEGGYGQGLYSFRWIRKVSGIPSILNEEFTIGIDSTTGKVVFWELGVFDYPKEILKTEAKLSAEEATERARLAADQEFKGYIFKPWPNFNPPLILYDRHPMWVVLLTTGDPRTTYYVQVALVHARKGEVEFLNPSSGIDLIQKVPGYRDFDPLGRPL